MLNIHINNNTKPLIFLGSNIVLEIFTESCEDLGIQVHGIMDKDYWGNTDSLCGVPVIDTEEAFNDPVRLQYYKENFNFFCAVNWIPLADAVSTRNREKRKYLIDLIEKHDLNCISIVDKFSKMSRHSTVGKGCFIDGYTHIMPRVTVGDFTNIYTHSHVAHDAVIGKNCVIQRMCVVPPESRLEDDVFFGSAVKALKDGAVFGQGTFIHEGIYIRRGTVPGEIVSMHGKNIQRVVSQYVD